MQNLLRTSLLSLIIAIMAGCGDGTKAPKLIDTGRVDSINADVISVKPDTPANRTIKK